MNLIDVTGALKLQATLAAGSTGSVEGPRPHHPITCMDELEFDEFGFRCPHAEVPAGEQRTQSCLDQSISVLLFELLAERERCP